MTLIDAGQRADRVVRRPDGRRNRVRTGPGPVRPPAGAVRYRGTGVVVSRAHHRPRPVSTAVTAGIAGLAALITVWLGLMAQAGTADTAHVPERLAVVQVRAGENLQQVAARMAPDAPVGRIVNRIKELNNLDSAAVIAGQTLVTPVG